MTTERHADNDENTNASDEQTPGTAPIDRDQDINSTLDQPPTAGNSAK
jgi:hypothetical protein